MTFSVLLRAVSLAIRFAFLLILAKTAPVAVVADYGVLAGFVAAASYYVGFDLYIQASRNVRRPSLYGRYLSNQMVFSSVALAVLAIAWPFWPPTITQPSVALLACVVLATDFVQQELARIALAHGRFHWANVIQFLRLGAWPALVLLAILAGRGSGTSIAGIARAWALTNLAAASLAALVVFRILRDFSFRPSLRLFRAGLPRQLMIFSSSAVLLLFSGIDRVLLGDSAPDAYVAAYVFFGSIYGVTLTLIYSGLINPYYSRLADKAIPWPAKRALLRRFSLVAVFFAGAVTVMLLAGMKVLLAVLGRAEYEQMAYLQVYFAVYVLVSVFGLIPHFALFAQRRDREIALASVFTLVAFLTCWGVLRGLGVPDAMPVTLCVGSALLALSKAAFFVRGAPKRA